MKKLFKFLIKLPYQRQIHAKVHILSYAFYSDYYGPCSSSL